MTRKIIAPIVLAAILVAGLVMGADAAKEKGIPEGRILRVANAYVLGSDVMDPTRTSSITAQKLLGGIFDSLIEMGPNGKAVPGLATRWYPNEERTVWTIDLRKGVQFHDGWGEMTAEDVKFSIERFMGPDSISVQKFYTRKLVKEVVVKDRYTLEIRLKSPDPDFVDAYLRVGSVNSDGMIMSKAYWDKVGKAGFLKHPIGTGRWKFVEHRPGDGITMDAYDQHWSGKKPGFRRVVLMEIPEEGTRVAMLKTGEADLVDLSVDSALTLKKMGYRILTEPDAAIAGLRIWGNWRPDAIAANTPTSHREVRKALSLAINRKELVDTLFGGLYEPVTFPGIRTSRTGFGVDSKKWTEWAKKAHRYDPDEAKRLLKQAGFPNGFEFTVWSYKASRTPWAHKVNEVLAAYWQAIGLRPKIEVVDFTGFFRPIMRKDPSGKTFRGSVALHCWANEAFPIAATADNYGIEGYTQQLDPTNKEWMELSNRVKTELDPDKRQKYFEELLLIIGEQYINPTLFYVQALYGVSNKVKEANPIPGLQIPSQWFHTIVPAN